MISTALLNLASDIVSGRGGDAEGEQNGLYTRRRCEIPNDRCDEEETMVAIISLLVGHAANPA